MFLLSFPLWPAPLPLSLSLQPDTRPLCFLSRPIQDELLVQRRTLPGVHLMPPHSAPHPGSQTLPPGLAFAGGSSFSFTCHPPSPVVGGTHSMIWHVLISFLSFSLCFFLLNMQIASVCTSEDKHY